MLTNSRREYFYENKDAHQRRLCTPFEMKKRSTLFSTNFFKTYRSIKVIKYFLPNCEIHIDEHLAAAIKSERSDVVQFAFYFF
jgi:hypothetical protein